MLILAIIALVLALGASMMQIKRDLMMLQQNSYRNERYASWLKTSGESTRYDRVCGLIVVGVALLRFGSAAIGQSLIIAFAVYNIVRLAIAKYKKPLVFTKRVWRIYVTSALVMAACMAALLGLIAMAEPVEALRSVTAEEVLGYCATCLVAAYSVSYLIVEAANWLLKPVEAHINKGYYDDAARILRSMPDLQVVGVTGSYGKTSTKHYLHRILQEQYDVLMTPGNFNTTLGVIRTVREHMKPYNQVFICEMGAKQLGDIKEICELVKPQIGIVTAVGPMHLESFGSIENVQRTKFELVDSLPADGLAVINNDFDMIANRPVDNVKAVRYSAKADRAADYHATDVQYTPHGTRFAIANAEGTEIELETKLVGECNVSNLVAAVIVALHLGVPADKIRYAVSKIEQVEHRLNIKRTPAGITIIDDAYNSNPVGAQMALDVLASMRQGKRIVITPGMIELGDDQHRLNAELGEAIAKACDVAIIVGEYNREALLEGIAKGPIAQADVHAVPSFAAAQQLMLQIAKAGDTVLYENDLPDTFK